MSWGEAVLLVAELSRESGSHLFAARAGFDFVASHADSAGIILAQAYLNSHRDREKFPQPVRLPGPIIPEDLRGVDEETRADITARARRLSAIRD